MEPRERSGRRRHRAKRRGTPLRGWRHKASGLLQRRHKSGMVFEAAVSGRRIDVAIAIAAHGRKPAARAGCMTSHRPATVCAPPRRERDGCITIPVARRLAAARRPADCPATPYGGDVAPGLAAEQVWNRGLGCTRRPGSRSPANPALPATAPAPTGRRPVMAARGCRSAGRSPSRPFLRNVAAPQSTLEMAGVSCHIETRQMA